MATSVPPFAALRVLEIACRLKSYSATGEVLGVTHSAVSQTVARLEATYGRKLFRRQGAQMHPTPAALALAAAYAEAARIIARASDALNADEGSPCLVLSTLPSVAKLWLSPRLKRLQEALPDISVEVRTSRDLADLERDGVDVALRFGSGAWPGLRAELLFDEIAFPVCSPEFLRRHGPFTDESIVRAPLILEDPPLWPSWFEAAGTPAPKPLRGLSFDDAAMVVEAAAAGLGVALVRPVHIEAAMQSGRLVRISTTDAKIPYSCYLVWRDDSPRIDAIRRFADWLLAECHRAGLLEAA
ncbi:MAG: LysR substrate-binding domain-containing protein [Caulobacterales bacterium]